MPLISDEFAEGPPHKLHLQCPHVYGIRGDGHFSQLPQCQIKTKPTSGAWGYDVASIFQVMDSVRQVGGMFFTVIAIR